MKDWLLSIAIAFASSTALAQPVGPVDLPTRPGVKQRVLIESPAAPAAAPTLVLLMGGNGQLGIYPNGSLQRDSHFLARVRGLLTARGHVVVLVDAPSDRRDLTGDFRESTEHATDLGAVIVHARKAFGKAVWLVGHSRGTHSAVTAATHLSGDAAPDGIVLAAPILESSRFGSATAKPLQDSGVETLRIPVLVLHHSQDACSVSPPAKLPQLQEKLPPATSRIITYEGGTSRGAFCEVQAFHSFNGIEQRVVDDLSVYVSQSK
jgi:alpha-beta hydrolase superfamily lysophospholipase